MGESGGTSKEMSKERISQKEALDGSPRLVICSVESSQSCQIARPKRWLKGMVQISWTKMLGLRHGWKEHRNIERREKQPKPLSRWHALKGAYSRGLDDLNL
eukprot:TRINITY_DN27598_c0_g1_i1.p1 TRINITY_DN27598_c0_g1~~TRINITY_DN27598_c0_g1_i1.p1  ORF type:complete len:102 (+),score=0.88 TRINITY_DN27598_c0_g1_i1:46-351(+)